MSRVARAALLALLAPVFVAPAARGQAPYTLDHVAPLTGCWAGDVGALTVYEQWTGAAGGLMLGATRFVRDGVVVDWEFGRIVGDGSGVTLWPYPAGEISPRGFPLVRAGSRLVFENLDHDFPVRIIYILDGPERVRIRVEGADGQGREWPVARAACDAATARSGSGRP